MPYARAPGRSFTAATSGGVRRGSPGAAIGDEAAWYQGAPYRPAAVDATTTLAARAALSRHRRVRRPPSGRPPLIDAGATVVQLTPVASGTAVPERFVTHGALSLAAGGRQTYRPARAPARVMLALSTSWTTWPIPSLAPRWVAPSAVASCRRPDGSARSPGMPRTGPSCC